MSEGNVHLLECKALASLFAAGMASITLLLSAGTADQPQREILFALGFSLLLINFPSSFFSRSTSGQNLADILGTSLIILCVVFLIGQPVAFFIPQLLTVLGIGFSAVVWIRLWQAGGFLWRVFRIVAIAGIYCFVVGQFVWGEGYRNPLDVLQFATSGSIHTDPAFHKAVIAMLKVHRTCSTGMDGLPAFAYHHATHLFAAQLGLLLNCSADALVCIVMPIFLPSILIHWTLRAMVQISEWINGASLSGPSSMGGHLLALAGFGGFLPVHMLFPFLNWNWSFTMDSQILAMIIVTLSFVGIRSLIMHSSISNQSLSASRLFSSCDLTVLVAAILSVALLAATKITVAHLYCLSMVYLVFRSARFLWQRGVAAFAIVLTLVICSSFFSVKTGSSLYFSPLSLWFERIPLTAWALFFPVNCFFAFVYAGIRLSSLKISTIADVLLAFRSRKIVDVELILLMSITGSMLTMLFGGKLAFNAVYYQCAAQFVAIVAASALLMSPSIESLRHHSIGSSFARLILTLLFLTSLLNSVEKWRDISRLNLQARGSDVATPLGMTSEPGKVEMRLLLKQGKIDETLQAIEDNTAATERRIVGGDRNLLGALIRLGKELGYQEKQRSLLWVSRENRQFWDMPRDGKRWLLPMIAVGLTEVAMIDGCPEEWEPIADGNAFGFSAYPNQAVSRDSALSLAEVKSKAISLGFQWVLELQDNGNVIKHQCL